MPTFRSSSFGGGLGTAPFAVSKPAGTVQGDFLISFYTTSGIFTPGEPNISGGDPWTLAPDLNVGNQWEKIHWKIAGASEPSSYSMIGPAGYTSESGIGAIIAISGADTVAPIIPAAAAWTSTTVTATPSLTPANVGDIDIRWLSGFDPASSSLSSTPPAGYTELVDSTRLTDVTMCLAYKQVTSTSPTGSLSFTSTTTSKSRGFAIGIGAYIQGWTGWGSAM